MRIMWMILVPIVLLFCFALIAIWVPLPHPFPAALSQARNLWTAVLTGILGIGYLGGLAVYLIAALLRAGQVLDSVCVPRDLIAHNYGLVGRQYTGQVDSRQVMLRYTPPVGRQRALFEAFLTANVGMRAAMGKRRPLLDCRECTRVEYSALQVYAQDPGRAEQLLAADDVEQALLHLLDNPSGAATAELYLEPERIWFRAHLQPDNAATLVEAWLEDLLFLTSEMEH